MSSHEAEIAATGYLKTRKFAENKRRVERYRTDNMGLKEMNLYTDFGSEIESGARYVLTSREEVRRSLMN
jgi:hypothetical protein